MNSPTILFIPVSDNAAKLKTICDIAWMQFLAGKPLLIAVPSIQAAHYVDALLWKMPEESFLPHCFCEQPSPERCVITTKPLNLNNATVLLNLCPQGSAIYREFECVYELWDQTDPAKSELSAQRKAFYGVKP